MNLTYSDSNALGRLFEQAAIQILEEMFVCWGCEITEKRLQRTGSQFGFDIFFKLMDASGKLNVFVECKASQNYNFIDAFALTQKANQLSWAGFPAKDVHVFFSPTRAIRFDNQILTIEDDSQPVVIIDWMRKTNGANPALELFAAYRRCRKNTTVLEYCELLFNRVDPHFTTSKTFEEICSEMKGLFLGRLTEHDAQARLKNYRIINGAFWKLVYEETQSEYLHYYYTKADSTPARLREAVANEFIVRNLPLEEDFEAVLTEAVKSRSALIKVLSKGGEGKSTFLYQIAKSCCYDYLVVWLESVGTDVLQNIERHASRLFEKRPLLIILDNLATHQGHLGSFANTLTTGFRNKSVVLVVGEREFRYKNLEHIASFEAVFNETHLIEYRSSSIREHVYEALISSLRTDTNSALDTKAIFLNGKVKSLTERIFSVLKYLKTSGGLAGYKFDWDDWESFAVERFAPLSRLYLVMATFFQFGFSLDIKFATSFLKDADEIDIKSVLDDNRNLPISRRGDLLQLRHETIASWYFDGDSWESQVNRENSEIIFKQFLSSINSPFARDLFIRLCIKNQDFRNSYLGKFVSDRQREAILGQYISDHPSELKCRTELSMIYQRQNRWQEAENILLESKSIDPTNSAARNELNKIYQRLGRWQEAENNLNELKSFEPNNISSYTELSKIYRRLSRWPAAEAILLEALKINSTQLNPRIELSTVYQRQGKWDDAITLIKDYLALEPYGFRGWIELSRIYQRQNCWTEAEDILLEYLKGDPQQLHVLTELSKIYQRKKQWRKAEDLLLQCLQIHPSDLDSRTELSRVYQRQKRWREAEDVLLNSLRIEAEQLHPRTELSKIYRHQRRWQEAEDILLAALEIEPLDRHARTELGKIYKATERLEEAEKILLEAVKIDPEHLHSRTELGKIYQQLEQWEKAEAILLECLRIDADDLDSRTELSKLYQKRGDLKQARRFLRECQSINPEDVKSLLELGKIAARDPRDYEEAEKLFQQLLIIEPGSLYGRIELANLYRKMRRFAEYQQILFDIYETHPNDIPTLTALSHVFKRFKKYRVCIRLLERALGIRQNDIIALTQLANVYSIVGAHKEAQAQIEKSRSILQMNPRIKHREHLTWLQVSTQVSAELVSLYEVGCLVVEGETRFVQSDTSRYRLTEGVVVNYKTKPGEKVFFGLYNDCGLQIANFVEPYFESLEHLDQLR